MSMIHFSHAADNMSWLNCERSETQFPCCAIQKSHLYRANIGGKSEIKAREGASLTLKNQTER